MAIGKDKKRLAVTLDADTAKCVEEMAKNENRSSSAMLAILVGESLKNRSKTWHAFVRGAYYYKSAIKPNNKEEIHDG